MLNYVSGLTIRDIYLEKSYYKKRSDVLMTRIYLPKGAPQYLSDLQRLCDEIHKAEKRYDARTARSFICSLPNELPFDEQVKIVSEFIEGNFTPHGIVAIAATHEGKSKTDSSRDNPHVHIIITTRKVDEKGFSKKKYRELNNRDYVYRWRKEWELIINRAYRRNKVPKRVSCESLEVQGKERIEPTIHLTRTDHEKEKRGIRTEVGDRKREIKSHNDRILAEKEKGIHRGRVILFR